MPAIYLLKRGEAAGTGKKGLCAALLVGALLLSGCNPLGQNVNELLRAPALPQGQGEIQKALAQSIGEEPQYIFPKEGDARSPLLMADLDGDGVEEGVLLYTYSSSSALGKNKGSNVYVSIMEHRDDGWHQRQELRGLAADVASLEAVDLLQNGTRQLVIGYANATLSNKVLGLYEYREGAYALVYQAPYSCYAMDDFTGSGRPALLLATPYDQAAGMQLIHVPVQYGIFATPQVVGLDASFVSCAGFSASRAAPGSTGTSGDNENTQASGPGRLVVLDGVLDSGIIASQFVYYSGGKFFTVDDSGWLKGQSARTSPLLLARDINGDGFVEIPRQVERSTMTSTGKGVTFVEWIDFINATPEEEEVLVREWGVLDAERGVYIRLPNDWRDNVTVIDGAGTGEWQMLRAATLETLLIMRELPAGSVLPAGAEEVPATVDSYLVVQYAVNDAEASAIRMVSLTV